MEVILLQRVEKLGQLGDVVKVKDGYARNFLLPQRKALRSTPENKAKFAVERADMEKVNAHRRGDAQSEAAALEGKVCVLLRQASENGHLYGSVTARDIAETVSSLGIKIDRTQVRLDKAIKALGVHPLRVYLHPEVPANVRVIIARSEAEAETQKQALARRRCRSGCGLRFGRSRCGRSLLRRRRRSGGGRRRSCCRGTICRKAQEAGQKGEVGGRRRVIYPGRAG